jgi:membrane associated rhomboid family serine protease
MGCGLPAAPGFDRFGNPFTTCCRSCALGHGHHDPWCQQDEMPMACSLTPQTVSEQQRRDEELATQLQIQEQVNAMQRMRNARRRIFEAAFCLFDPVWGAVEFKPIEVNDQWAKKKRKQVFWGGMFGICPCLMLSIAIFGREKMDIKDGATRKDVKTGYMRMFLSFSFLLAIPQLASVILHEAGYTWVTDDGIGFADAQDTHGFGTSGRYEARLFDAEGAKNAAKIIYDNEWWRLITPIFVHGGWGHLVGNLVVQLRTALVLEVIWGHAAWFVIYFVSGAMGTIWSCIFNPNILSVGSSGALCGVVGGWPMFIIITWNQYSPKDRKQRDKMMVLIMIAICLLIGFSFMPLVDWAAHFGGLVVGVQLSATMFAHKLQTRSYAIVTGAIGCITLTVNIVGSMYLMLNYVHPDERLLQL